MTREDVLNTALRRVTAKPEEYGTPENAFSLIADLWGYYLSEKNGAIELTPADVANMMILLKVARNTQGNKDDTWVDIAGYAACGAEVEECTHTKICRA